MSGHKRTTIRTNLQNLKEFSQAEMSLRFVEAGMDQLNRRMDNHTKQVRKQQAKRDQDENKCWRDRKSVV